MLFFNSPFFTAVFIYNSASYLLSQLKCRNNKESHKACETFVGMDDIFNLLF